MDTGHHLFSVDAYSRTGRFVPGPVACDRSYALPGHPTRGEVHRFSKELDWIAGSRSHVVDDILVRGFILVPMMFGFSHEIVLAYLIFVTLHATWTHCNFGPSVKWLEPFLVMPRYHHWHHSSQTEAIDKNFAFHFPWIDKLFFSYYYPQHWPQTSTLAPYQTPTAF